jgi:dihydropteroate synthase
MNAPPTPPRASTWQLRTRELACGPLPLVMGIVNVTPDSFSDGGRFFEASRAIEHARQLAAEGADILDLGAESTRPGAAAVAPAEQIERLAAVFRGLAESVQIPLSIDTRSAEVAEVALAAGAEIINDVSGLQADPRMLQLALASGAGICVMHMQGTPETMQQDPQYEDVVSEVGQYLRQRRDTLVTAGISPARICLDPGIGFGKRQQHNLELMRHCGRLHELGCPLLVGHSRKGFLGKVIGDLDADRSAATLGAAIAAAQQGVQVLRVHEVRRTKDALLAWEACRPKRH